DDDAVSTVVRGLGGLDQGLVAGPDAHLDVVTRGDAEHADAGARAQEDPDAVSTDGAVLDGDHVEDAPLVGDGRAGAQAPGVGDGVSLQVDGDLVGGDDQAVAAAGQIVGELVGGVADAQDLARVDVHGPGGAGLVHSGEGGDESNGDHGCAAKGVRVHPG